MARRERRASEDPQASKETQASKVLSEIPVPRVCRATKGSKDKTATLAAMDLPVTLALPDSRALPETPVSGKFISPTNRAIGAWDTFH
jgi:hypothetical protein